jgi:tetratricopeptide (TPR) repeat protein
MMLSIFAKTDLFNILQQFIQSENRLEELVQILDIEVFKPSLSGLSMVIEEDEIHFPMDWSNALPPYLLPENIPFTQENFLGVIFGKLNNLEKSADYLGGKNSLYHDFSLAFSIQNESLITEAALKATLQKENQNDFEPYRQAHNQAIATHYGAVEKVTTFEALCEYYKEAIKLAPKPEYLAFTSRQYVTLLLDAQYLDQAEEVIEKSLKAKPSQTAEFALKSLLTQVLMGRVYVPYDWKLIEQIKGLVWEALQYFEEQKNYWEMALLLIDASEIANINQSYTESLGYINKSIALLEQENLTQFLGNAQIRKGTLLYTWAQNGNPQFYRGSLMAYQEALKIYKREESPEMFAEIHHQLGIIYSEMPDEPQKQQIWAAMSAKSFGEALDYFTKANFPYEYAMISNNYANALTKFPTGLRADNYQQAIKLYEEALQIRTADLPYERAITLLNYLESQWFMTQDEDKVSTADKLKIWESMKQKAEEVLDLVEDNTLQKEAKGHLEKLDNLKSVLLEE